MQHRNQKGLLIGFMASLLVFIGLVLALRRYGPGPLWGDQAVQDWMFSLRSDAMTDTMGILTQTGSTYAFILVMLLAGGILIGKRRVFEAMCLLIQLAVTWGMYKGLKSLFERPRPDIEYLTDASGFSFPSGNALMASAFYAFTVLLLIQLPRMSQSAKSGLIVLGCLLIVAAGFSRLYMGVHYASDIAAGYAAGIAWFCASGWMTKRLTR